MAHVLSLNDAQWASIESYVPRHQPGAHRLSEALAVSGSVTK